MAFTLIPLLGSFSLEWHGQDSVIQLKPPYSSVLYQWFCWRQEHMYSYYGFKCISGCTSHLVFLFQYIHTCIHTYICIIYILSCLTWTRAVGVLSLGADFRPQQRPLPVVFRPLFKPQTPNDTATDTTFPSGCCHSPLVASSFSVCF